jgi:hypothetical protein
MHASRQSKDELHLQCYAAHFSHRYRYHRFMTTPHSPLAKIQCSVASILAAEYGSRIFGWRHERLVKNRLAIVKHAS